jgi:predicted ATP-dependent endonuclease of OLD family
MLLNSLSIVGLHGELSLDVRFNEDITLLVGINGSGKTSVLNAIEWLLKPDLQRLAVADYTRLALRFVENATSYELAAIKTASTVTLSIHGSKSPLKPIIVSLNKAASQEEEEGEEFYRGLSPENHELPMWDLLKSFTKPTVISLDRSVSAEADEIHYIETPSGAMRRRVRSRSPMGYVQ